MDTVDHKRTLKCLEPELGLKVVFWEMPQNWVTFNPTGDKIGQCPTTETCHPKQVTGLLLASFGLNDSGHAYLMCSQSCQQSMCNRL